MTFDLTTILIFCIAALVYTAILPARLREWALLLGSLLAIYWLQPRIVRVPYVDFTLPTVIIALTVTVWWMTRQRTEDTPQPITREDWLTLGLILAVIIGVALSYQLGDDFRLTTRPPALTRIIIGLLSVGAIITGLSLLLQRVSQGRILSGLILLIVGLFVLIKTESLAIEVARFWREQTGRDPSLAGVGDLAWLGFSYLAFRMIHALRDRQTGKLPELTLRQFTTYALFFPAYTSGPIDRAERFQKDLLALHGLHGLDPARITEGLTRIAVGIFKKFIIADTIGQGLALNATNATQIESTLGQWTLLYGYALQLFFDFSGYSDIAIGIGILFGIKLPENFDRPYLKNNITTFWQSWHMTLSNWARFYVFTPITRLLLTRKVKPPTIITVLSSQLATMIVIGLWHGVSWNFLIWGAWHGVGLFIHKQWSDRTRTWYRGLNDKPSQKRAWTFAGWFITFHFVVIGWVWFALPDFDTSLNVLQSLFGLW